MLLLSQSRQLCHSHSERHGQVHGAMLSQTPSHPMYYKPAQTVLHH